jgi:hypothetical protein
MAKKTPTAAEKRQQVARQHQLVQAALTYMRTQLLGKAPDPTGEVAAHFEHLRTQAAEYQQQQKLAVLKKWFRDIAAPALVDDGPAFAAYIKQATGLDIDVQSDFEKRIARVCKRKRIRTDTEFYDVRDMIDSLDPFNLAHETQLQLLYDLVAEFEGFLDASEVGKPRPPVPPRRGTTTEVLLLPSPDGSKVLRITESVYDGEPDRTQLMLEYPASGAGMGLYHANQVGAGITARWEGNSRLVVDVRQAPFNEQYPRRELRGGMYDQVDVELLSQ